MNTFILLSVLILVNINSIVCDESEAEGQTQTSIDVDLKNIKSEDFDIIKSVIDIDPSDDNKLESYKLTPKKTKKISRVTYGNIDVWNTKISAECSNITIYSRNCVYFVLKTIENNEPSYIYFRQYKTFIGATGVLSLLYDINYPYLSNLMSKPYTLNISNNFDKLYFNYRYKQKGIYRYESFEPNEGETFGLVTDNIDTIWSPTQSPLSYIGLAFAKKVRVFKQETYVRNRQTGRGKMLLVYKFLIVVAIDNRTDYFKVDEESDKWVKIDVYELKNGIKMFAAKNLYYFDSDEPSSSDNESDRNELFALDIFKRNSKVKCAVTNVYPFRVINLFKGDVYRVNEIRYNNMPIIKYDFLMFIINIFNTRYDWYYLEIVIKSDQDLTKVKELGDFFVSKLGTGLYGIYFSIYDRRKEVENISRNSFLDSLETYVTGYGNSDYVKYANFYELNEGSEAADLSEAVKLKIDPHYGKKRPAVSRPPNATPVTTTDDGEPPGNSLPKAGPDARSPGDSGLPSDGTTPDGDGNPDDTSPLNDPNLGGDPRPEGEEPSESSTSDATKPAEGSIPPSEDIKPPPKPPRSPLGSELQHSSPPRAAPGNTPQDSDLHSNGNKQQDSSYSDLNEQQDSNPAGANKQDLNPAEDDIKPSDIGANANKPKGSQHAGEASEESLPPPTTSVPQGEIRTPGSANNINGNNEPPSDTDKGAKSDKEIMGEGHKEAEGGKAHQKASPDSTSPKNGGADKNHEDDGASRDGGHAAVRKEAFEVSVVFQPMVRFVRFLSLGPDDGDHRPSLRVDSKRAGFTSNIARLSMLIIITSMLI
ncbi:conserved hypothetical protein [Theileria orientalis strain Shintoku]|uniref:Uncharacterized protein n=1 Tax=Theileria orientalis strain Shintoku TaxID=869250 RepID=J7MCF7_THEOR|nr:conserved hypothetical protein [Theileria orientalis strain Shintoku]BAM42482.1 conserved hypothetical protein [Theileria orientalis strain Shintoku]|eukprot:XP_009692783.1 conserved hypothetical protein [Theileria orientalis strain Shintoku]